MRGTLETIQKEITEHCKMKFQFRSEPTEGYSRLLDTLLDNVRDHLQISFLILSEFKRRDNRMFFDDFRRNRG